MKQAMDSTERLGQSDPLMEIKNLSVDYLGRQGTVKAVRGFSLSIRPGETVGLVGESGSGKSATAAAIMGVLQPPGVISGGDILWRGDSLVHPDRNGGSTRPRGNAVSMIFQDPSQSLDPLSKVGTQITEVLKLHMSMSGREAESRAVELLRTVGINSPEQRVKQFPYELSGGMRQRVMIAIALACDPDLLIADEPTTALDVTVQLQIVELLRRLQEETGVAILLISHDLGLIAETCDRVAVLYAGRACEVAPVHSLFAEPSHPYTVGLLDSSPSIESRVERLNAIPGAAPSMAAPPSGCAFHPRCPIATDSCNKEMPELEIVSRGDVLSACLFPEKVHKDLFKTDW